MAHPPSDDEGFVGRWSRLKQRARDDMAREAEPPPPVPAAAATDEQKAPEEEKKPFDLSELPSVESLTKESDYSGFMRAEVPEDLRQKALRRLWASDPVLSAPDLFDMHNLDYNNVPTFPEGFRTIARAAQEILDSPADQAEKQGAAAKPEGETKATTKISPCVDAGSAALQHPEAVPSRGTPEKPTQS
jgi:Protein of unknown function (DUF3306)